MCCLFLFSRCSSDAAIDDSKVSEKDIIQCISDHKLLSADLITNLTYETCTDEFHPHSAVTYDRSPLSETELLWRNTAHRMDVLQHTCHGSVSMHGRNAAWYLYPGRTFHRRKMWIFPANAPFTFFMVLPENRAVWTARATIF